MQVIHGWCKKGKNTYVRCEKCQKKRIVVMNEFWKLRYMYIYFLNNFNFPKNYNLFPKRLDSVFIHMDFCLKTLRF